AGEIQHCQWIPENVKRKVLWHQTQAVSFSKRADVLPAQTQVQREIGLNAPSVAAVERQCVVVEEAPRTDAASKAGIAIRDIESFIYPAHGSGKQSQQVVGSRELCSGES